jgi:hypothetical protein
MRLLVRTKNNEEGIIVGYCPGDTGPQAIILFPEGNLDYLPIRDVMLANQTPKKLRKHSKRSQVSFTPDFNMDN